MTVPAHVPSLSVPGPAPTVRGRDPRSGIALVIVLGMMALLMVLAVGFFVAMRTERLAARSFADEVRARQMAHAAITRAVADVNTEIAGANRVIPNWPNEVKVSGGDNAGFSLSTNVMAHVPGFLVPAVLSQAGNVGWITAPYGNGRFGYMAVNVSGLLDPNRDYSTTNSAIFPRDVGFDANEIAYGHNYMYSALRELATTSSTATMLFQGRTSASYRNKPYLRAETVPDLWIVGRYNYGGPLPLRSYPESFFPYSYFPPGYRADDGSAQEAVYIGGTPQEVANRQADIEAQFLDMGLTATDASHAAINLIDFLDEDSVPGGINGGAITTGPNCDSFSTEPVPMLHQFRITSVLYARAGGTREVRINVRAQVWYPFVQATNLQYRLRVQVTLNGGGYTVLPPQTLALGSAWAQDTVASQQMEFIFTNSSITPPTSVTVNELAVLDPQGRVVDRVCGPDRPATLTPWNSNFAGAFGVQFGSWWWVGDPRINWLWRPELNAPAADNHWRIGSRRTVNEPNWAARHPSVQGEYGRTEMYVRNRGELRTVGELGLMVGRANDSPLAWKTIRLLGPASDGDVLPVFDRFTVNTNVLQGIVNPNTLNHRPLQAVLLNALAARWPDESGAPRLNVAQSQEAALAIRNAYGGTNPFNNRSDLARVETLVGALDGAQDEGVMRNSGQLFSTRQNLFLVIVRGQALSPSGGIVMGEAQAVALVWRDPYLVNGRNQTRIRWIKWMEQ
jgi:hypothetical protein